MQAAIRTLDEIGFARASLAQIAKRAGISTALISYHFADKLDLMNHLLINLLQSTSRYVTERVNREQTPEQKLNAFIRASLEYLRDYPDRSIALIEIIFHARTPDNVPYYRMDDEDEDPALQLLRSILREGQQQGVFGDFHPDAMAHFIQGAISEYMLDNSMARRLDLDTYSDELIRIVNRAVRKDSHG
jgi:AcrR family transcriptional regulator